MDYLTIILIAVLIISNFIFLIFGLIEIQLDIDFAAAQNEEGINGRRNYVQTPYVQVYGTIAVDGDQILEDFIFMENPELEHHDLLFPRDEMARD